MVIATSATKQRRAKIAAGTVIHVTDLQNLPKIITSTDAKSSRRDDNCEVFLKAGQGWNIAPFRLFRDYSVLDTELSDLKDWGRYLYFFGSEPSRWAMMKNLNTLKTWEELQNSFGIIRVSGAELISRNGGPVFYRSDDDTIIIRGDYSGPAQVSPMSALSIT